MTVALAIAGGLLGALVALHLELNLLAAVPRRALRVLMYHRIGDHPGRDTVAAAELDRQLSWLRANRYRLVSLDQVLAHRSGGAPLPERAVLLTFDDGTRDHLDELLPILQRHSAPAVLFVVPDFVGRELTYGGHPTAFLGAPDLRALAGAGLRIGLHSFGHRDLTGLAPEAVEEDVARSLRWFTAEGIPVEPVLAYPFGAYPRRDPVARERFFGALRRAGVRLAFRIGNRVNPMPLSTDFEVQRIGVRRTDRIWSFAIKVRKGRRRAFA